MRSANSWAVTVCWTVAAVFFLMSMNYRSSLFAAEYSYDHRFKTDNASGAAANALEYIARHERDVSTANACLVCSVIFLLMGCVERLRFAVIVSREPFSPPPRLPAQPSQPEPRNRDWETTAAFLQATNPEANPGPTIRELGNGFGEMWRQTKAEFQKLLAYLRGKPQ